MNRHHYRECGLDNIFLVNGFERVETEYGAGVRIDRADELDEAIAKALTEKPAPLTGKEFRFLRVMLDMSQRRIGELMGKEAQTVATWERSPALNPDVDFLIRHIYRQTAIDQSDSYVEMVNRLNHLDRAEHDEGMKFKTSESGWSRAA